MDAALPVIAGIIGALFGWWLPAHQHALYREPAFREHPASGGTLLGLRLFTVPSAAATAAFAFRPAYAEEPRLALFTAAACLVLVALSSTDFDRRRIPNRLVYPAALAALAAAPFWPDRSFSAILIGGAAATSAGISLVILGAVAGRAAGSRQTAFGLGDARLMGLIGLAVGWPAVVTALFLGIIFAGGAALVLLVLRGRGTTYSYGPYLAAGAVIVLLWFDRFA